MLPSFVRSAACCVIPEPANQHSCNALEHLQYLRRILPIADADYQDFLAELEKDPYSLPGAKFRGEGEGPAGEGEVPASNADGKRVSALMQYLEQKWAGKLDGGSENRKTSRQVAFSSAIPPVFSMQSWNITACGLNCMQNLGMT